MGPLKYVDARGKCAFMLRPHKLYVLQLSPWALGLGMKSGEEMNELSLCNYKCPD